MKVRNSFVSNSSSSSFLLTNSSNEEKRFVDFISENLELVEKEHELDFSEFDYLDLDELKQKVLDNANAIDFIIQPKGSIEFVLADDDGALGKIFEPLLSFKGEIYSESFKCEMVESLH